MLRSAFRYNKITKTNERETTNMKKYVSNGLSFASVGIIIGLAISIFFSYLSGAGEYYPSSMVFMNNFANPLDAVLLSLILWGLMGLLFGFGAMIFNIKKWSTLKQTAVNFALYFVLFTPLAILAGWFPLTLGNLTVFTIIFVIIYAFCWTIGWMINHVNKEFNNIKIRL